MHTTHSLTKDMTASEEIIQHAINLSTNNSFCNKPEIKTSELQLLPIYIYTSASLV